VLLSSSSWAARASALPPVIAFTSATEIDEGMSVAIDISVYDPEGATVTWSWDTDFDGTFDEMPGATSYTVPATATDGPAMLRIGVRATDGTETRTVYRNITVRNIAPLIESTPPDMAAVRREYRYEPTLIEPAGDNDPLTLELTMSPPGMVVMGTAITWTPTPDQRGTTFDVVLTVSDGDGGEDTQAWGVGVANNTAPMAPVPVSPTMDQHFDAGASITLTVMNGSDADGDPLQYYFELSRTVSFSIDVIESGPIDEDAAGMTSWTVTEPLDAGQWYWRVWVSDGIASTTPTFGRFAIGSAPVDAGTTPRDSGTVERPDGGFVLGLDAGTEVSDSGCSCSLAKPRASSSAPPLGALAFAVTFAAWSVRRRRRPIAIR